MSKGIEDVKGVVESLLDTVNLANQGVIALCFRDPSMCCTQN
jgi:hypothetical protein